MTLWQAVRYCIVNKYASGKGRAGKGEFFSYFLAYVLFCLLWCLFVLANMDFFGDINLVDFVLMYIPFVFLPPLIAVTIRRLHDTGKSGLLFFLFLVPLLNLFGFALLLLAGDPGPNRFGNPPPKVDF